MRLIDADPLEHFYEREIKNISGMKEYAETLYSLNAALTNLKEEKTISADEGVKIIWSAQIDHIIERIKRLAWESDVVDVEDVIEILEDAKQ